MSDFEDGAWSGRDSDEDKTRVVQPRERREVGTGVPAGSVRSDAGADPYSVPDDSPYAAPADSPYPTPGMSGSGYAAPSGADADADKTVVDPNAAARVRSGGGARPYADPYGDRDTAPRAYVASPPQQPPYSVEQDEGLGGGGVASRPVDSRRALKIFGLGFAVAAAIFIAFQVGSCVAGSGRSVADAGTNAVGTQGISGSKGSGANDSGSDDASDAGDSSDASDEDASSSDKDDAASKGADIGSSVGSAVGDAVGSAVDKLGSVDTSNITEKLGSAAGDIGDAAKDLLGQLTSN